MGRELANNIDLGAYLSAENKGVGSEASKKLTEAVNNYNKYLAAIGDSSFLSIEAITEALKNGGYQAVSVMTQIAELQGKELSSDEVVNAFRSHYDKLIQAVDEVTA